MPSSPMLGGDRQRMNYEHLFVHTDSVFFSAMRAELSVVCADFTADLVGWSRP
jgi:hypothetical protein